MEITRATSRTKLTQWLIILATLLLAVYVGRHPSRRLLVLIVGSIGVVVLLREIRWGLVGLVVAALFSPLQLGTGTEVALNLAVLMVPGLALLWVLDMLLRHDVRLAPSTTSLPLALFLLAGLLSLFLGNALWDPAVPRSGNFLLVQLAQWSIFALAAGIYWVTGNIMDDEKWLRRLTNTFILLGGVLALLMAFPASTRLAMSIATIAVIRAPFWATLAAMAGGQLLFNRSLGRHYRWFMWLVIGAAIIYSFSQQRERVSDWVGVSVALGTLVWLRFPRLRLPAILMAIIVTATGLLFPVAYEFAGGDAQWAESGASRLVLISRVVELAMRNPITGLGPASYRAYGFMKPLVYEHIIWQVPTISSHNNYIDIFAHTGLVGLGLFLWFVGRLLLLVGRLWSAFQSDFARAYIGGALAVTSSSLVLMLLADWFLPFVYNIGFAGFQASILSWMFLGGLLVYEKECQASHVENVAG